MSALVSTHSHDSDPLAAAIDAACGAIAPTWPLDRFIAVNPYWGRVDQSFDAAGRTLQRLAGSTLQMNLGFYRAAWRCGEIDRDHLLCAIAESGLPLSEQELINALHDDDSTAAALPLPSDALDAQRDLSHEPAWRDAITHQITQFCAAYFDRDQANWQPDRRAGLYAGWRESMTHDHSIALLMHAREVRQRARCLPPTAAELIPWAVEQLAVPTEHLEELLQVVLLRVNGWAAWCAYLRWQARLAGADDDHIVDLLAIRLAWECLLDDGNRDTGSVWARWQSAWCGPPVSTANAINCVAPIWQRAQELAYQQPLASALAQNGGGAVAEQAAAQVVFCIDVRSEVFRRALESVDAGMQTLGFAGFFGLPAQYTPIGTQATRPQLPGLLPAVLEVTDSTGMVHEDEHLASTRRSRLRSKAGWQPFKGLPGSAFSLVETVGLGFLGNLIRRSLPGPASRASVGLSGFRPAEAARVRPRLVVEADDNGASQADLAERILRSMSLTADFARLVVLVGHGSQSANNPHAAGLDCGACCGQTGEVNARAVAGLLNDPAVRASVAARGISIPDTTFFVPGLHNTTTDEVVLFDREGLPSSHSADLERLRTSMAEAGQRARAERAPALGLGSLVKKPGALSAALRARANDWSQTRPEWGLANNAAFIAAPRARTRGMDLDGRAFLHEYDYRRDADGSVLELIMTAPMIVAHWINMQYHASTVDNLRYGSGNKVLHNVVGGRIGVFEGNGGDLRVGLSRQSVHDGRRWMHTPLRLAVFIEAPRAAIDSVIDKHTLVRQLIENRWLYLFRLQGNSTENFENGKWRSPQPEKAAVT